MQFGYENFWCYLKTIVGLFPFIMNAQSNVHWLPPYESNTQLTFSVGGNLLQPVWRMPCFLREKKLISSITKQQFARRVNWKFL